MRHSPEPMPEGLRWLYDVSRVLCVALVLVPAYLLCNDYWRSLLRLLALYGLLFMFCCRLGGYVRRVFRRLPADIPPWHMPTAVLGAAVATDTHFATAETIRSVSKDPHYVQEVLKPRLQQLLSYRLNGVPATGQEGFDGQELAQLEPTLQAFFQRREATQLWARYWHRRQRVDDVLAVLRSLEKL